jgi:TolB-like protein
MNTVRTLAVALVVLLLAASCAARGPRPLDYSQYHAISVVPFQTEGFLERYGAEVADQVIIEILARDPEFPIVERAEVDRLLRERSLRAETERSGEGPTLIPADLLIAGSVAYAVEDLVRPGPAREARLTATVRAIETESGRIVWAARFRGSGDELLSSQAGGSLYRYQSDAELREQAVQDLAVRIVRGMLGAPQGALK